MARKQVVICTCDLCGKSVDNETQLKCLSIPVRFTTEQTEGRTVEPYYVNEKMDLCESCLRKVTVVTASGAMGYNRYSFMNK